MSDIEHRYSSPFDPDLGFTFRHPLQLSGVKPQYSVTADGRVWLNLKSGGHKEIYRAPDETVRLYTIANDPVDIDADTLVCFAIHGPRPDPAMVVERRVTRKPPNDLRPATHGAFLAWKYPPDPSQLHPDRVASAMPWAKPGNT